MNDPGDAVRAQLVRAALQRRTWATAAQADTIDLPLDVVVRALAAPEVVERRKRFLRAVQWDTGDLPPHASPMDHLAAGPATTSSPDGTQVHDALDAIADAADPGWRARLSDVGVFARLETRAVEGDARFGRSRRLPLWESLSELVAKAADVKRRWRD